MLDVAFARSQFPALAGEWVYLDNAGGSQVLQRVVDRIADYLLTSNVQHGATYAVSQLAAERQHQAQLRLAELLNAGRPEEVVFGPTSTMLLQLLARAMVGRVLAPGDEVIVTRVDHESNIGPWVRLEANGIVPRFWETSAATGALELGDLERLMTPRTRLVCVTHASNIYGTINPVADIARFVHERGAQIAVDGVAFAPHRTVDVQALDVDYYVVSLYKVYGPHHAVLYGRYDHLRELAGQYHYFIGDDRVPYKLQPGNPNYELSYGSIGIVEYLADLGTRAGETATGSPRARLEAAFDAVAEHEAALADRLLDYLRDKRGVRVVGSPVADPTVRVPTLSFVAEGVDSPAIVRHIDTLKIGIRHGDFHSRRLVDQLGLQPQGVVRVSMVHYNTVEEIDRLIEGLEQSLG
jgi:cysteine desulfurase family protein (TIGR01976 family)